MSEKQIIREKTDSISLSRTSTGKYSWEIKIYSENILDKEEAEKMREMIDALNEKMMKKYGGGVNV